MEHVELGPFYRNCRRTIFACAMRLLKDEQAALDIVQDAFVRVLRHREKLEHKADPSGWIRRIATNLCIDELRKRRDARFVSREHVEDEPAPRNCEFGPQVAYENEQLREMLRGSLAVLDERHHHVFVMREVEGLSYREIAHRVRCPPGTVMSRLHHARRKLRDDLGRRLQTETVFPPSHRMGSRAAQERGTGLR